VASRATKTRSPDSNSRNNCHDKRRAADHYGFAALFIELRSSAPFSTRSEPTRASDGGFQGAVAKLKIAFAEAGNAKSKCVLQNALPSFAARKSTRPDYAAKIIPGRHVGGLRVTAHHRWYHAAYFLSGLRGIRGQLQSGHKENAPWLFW
jgi:hypothetical protein